jgi:hypothetical protein
MRAARCLACLACGAVVLAACQRIAGIHDEPGATPPSASSDAGPDASRDSTAPDSGVPDVQVPCPGRRPPLSLKQAAPGNPNSLSTFALRTIQFQGVTGYDLDCHLTQGGADLPCSGSPDDLEGGVDSELNALLKQQLPGTDPVGDHFTAEMARGAETVLLEIANAKPPFPSNVNGLQFALISSNGLQYVNCNQQIVDGSVPPNWDGCDSWREDVDFKVYITADAYIRNNEFVAIYPANGAVPTIFLSGMRLELHQAIITARIVTHAAAGADGGALVTLEDGVIAGRVSTADAVRAVLEYRDEGKKPLCAYPGAAGPLESVLCPSRDMPNSGNGTATDTCDSLSFTAGFEAVPAGVVSGGTLAFDAGCLPYNPNCPSDAGP